jgi:hypothetical protein
MPPEILATLPLSETDLAHARQYSACVYRDTIARLTRRLSCPPMPPNPHRGIAVKREGRRKPRTTNARNAAELGWASAIRVSDGASMAYEPKCTENVRVFVTALGKLLT